MFCPKCGHDNPAGGAFCMKCGTALAATGPAEPWQDTPPASGEQQIDWGTPAGPYAPAPSTPPKKRRVWLYVAVGAAVLLLLALGIAAALLLPRLLPPSQHAIVAFPNRDGTVDLYMMELGQEPEEGVLLAEEVRPTNNTLMAVVDPDASSSQRYGGGDRGRFGGFLPDSDRAYIWFQDGSREVLGTIAVGEQEVAELIHSREGVVALVFPEQGRVFLRESLGDQYRCYGSKFSQEPERLAKGDECWSSPDGSTVYWTEGDWDEKDLLTIDLDGKNEGVAVEGVEGLSEPQISYDGSHLAYIQSESRDEQLYLAGRDGKELVEIGREADDIVEHRFLGRGDELVYVTGDSDGTKALYTSHDAAAIAEGETLSVETDPTGRYLVYAVGDARGEKTVYVQRVPGGEPVELMDGEGLSCAVIASPLRVLILVQEGDRASLYSADMAGKELLELYHDRDGAYAGATYVPGEPRLYLLLNHEDGTESLVVTSVDQADAVYLVEEWNDVNLLSRSPDGRQLVFSGQEDEGDDPALYSITVEEGASAVKLEEDIINAYPVVFQPNGASVLYGTSTGPDASDVSIFQVPADGSASPETLYRHARLDTVHWDTLHPFEWVSWQ